MAAGIFQKDSIECNMRNAIGIDLGCTNIKAVLVDETGTVLREARQETQEDNDGFWKSSIKKIVTDLKRESNGVAAVGLCAPGLANSENTFIACMPGRLPGLEKFNWSELTGERVHVLNDAHAALTAEAAFGAAKGLQHAVLITLGSGVGGGILVDGQLYQGMSQMAGHLGHMTVDASTHVRDVTNMPGSIEDAIGNITIAQRSYGKYMTTFDLIEAHNRGEPFASWLWLDAVRKLSICIASCVNLVAPQAVVIGGGIGQAGEALMKPLREFLDIYEWKPTGRGVELRPAHFSDMAGAIGAAGFALTKSMAK